MGHAVVARTSGGNREEPCTHRCGAAGERQTLGVERDSKQLISSHVHQMARGEVAGVFPSLHQHRSRARRQGLHDDLRLVPDARRRHAEDHRIAIGQALRAVPLLPLARRDDQCRGPPVALTS